MKTINDYQMFFQGYLEALTDIDGDQREFGVYVRMFKSNKKEHLDDIQREFKYEKPIEPIYSKKFKNFYSKGKILEGLLFVNVFNGAKVPKKSVKSFRDYILFRLSDYIDFSFGDADWRLGSKKSFDLFVKRGEKINTIFLVMSAEGKKLVFRFYRNKKYVSDEAFDKWFHKIIENEEKNHIAGIKKSGIRQHKINYNEPQILDH